MDLILIEKLNQALFHKKYNPKSLPGLTETSSSNLTSHHYVIIWFWTFRKQTLYLENSFNFLFNIFEPTSFHDLPSVYQFLARLNLNFYYLTCDCENWKMNELLTTSQQQIDLEQYDTLKEKIYFHHQNYILLFD